MIYQRYIFKNNLITTLTICAILIFLIWFSRVSSFVVYITENGVEVSKFLKLFILILPWLLMIIIPISLFLAILITFNRFTQNNEITIFKNCGLTKFSICKPIFILALIFTVLCYINSFYLMPMGARVLRESRNNISENYSNLKFKSQTFESFKDLTIYSKSRDSNDNLFEIFLNDQRSPNYSLTITAKKGRIVIDNKSAFLEMEDGTLQKFNFTNKTSEILKFDSYIFNLSEKNKINYKNSLKANEYYFHELFDPPLDLPEKEYHKIFMEINERIIDPMLCLVLALIALSSILSGEFKRNKNSANTIKAVLLSSIYFILVLLSYGFIKISYYLAIIPYLILILFIGYSLNLLKKNYRLKNVSKEN